MKFRKAKLINRYRKTNPFEGIFIGNRLFKHLGLNTLVTSLLQPRANVHNTYPHNSLLLFDIYLCRSDHIENINKLHTYLETVPNSRIPTTHTPGRAIKQLTETYSKFEENSTATLFSIKKQYRFNLNPRLNHLRLAMNKQMGLGAENTKIDIDFDHVILPREEENARYTYTHKRGYFPSVTFNDETVLYIKNRDGNTNIRFKQEATLENMFARLETQKIGCLRANCGSYSKHVVEVVERLKRFVVAFMQGVARRIKQGRQWILTLYTDFPYEKLWIAIP